MTYEVACIAFQVHFGPLFINTASIHKVVIRHNGLKTIQGKKINQRFQEGQTRSNTQYADKNLASGLKNWPWR